MKLTAKESYKRIMGNIRKNGMYSDKFRMTPTELQCREKLKTRIEKCAFGAPQRIAVYIWSRDCDMCESDRMVLIPASVVAYLKKEEEEYEWAEGPLRMHIATEEEYLEFNPTFRDRIGEAWDNGNTSPFYV